MRRSGLFFLILFREMQLDRLYRLEWAALYKNLINAA